MSTTIVSKPKPNILVKHIVILLSLVVALANTAIGAQSAPVTLTLRSYQTFTENFTAVVDAVSPGSASEALEDMRSGLGIQELKGIDTARPWQIAVWVETLGVPPCVSIRVPVSDFAAFRDGLNPGVLKGREDQGNKIQQVEDYAVIWMEFGSPSETAAAAEKAWKPDMLDASGGVVRLMLKPSSALREEMAGAVGMGRMAIGAALSSQGQQAAPGLDPKVMAELMGVYFDVIETVVKGFESLDLNLDLKGNKVLLKETIVPVPDSVLAGWLKVKEGELGVLRPYLVGDAPMGMAMRFEENEGLMPTINRFIALSLQVQGLPADSDVVQQTEELVRKFVPFQFAGTLEMNQGIQFGGIYQFPGKDSAVVYDSMKDYLRHTMQSQVGEGKPYSSLTFEDGVRRSNGVAVDRATMALNLESPIYQAPGQKEMVKNLMPDGKMTVEYALKGKDLLMGTPGRLDAILAGPPAGATYQPTGVNPHTMAYGFMNVFKFLPPILAANPMMSEEDKARFNKVDSEGTAFDFRIDIDNQFDYLASIPLKFFRTIGQLAEQ